MKRLKAIFTYIWRGKKPLLKNIITKENFIMTTKFTKETLELLNKAIKEELAYDIRIHRAEQYETTRLFERCINHPEDEIAYSALMKCLDFWNIYFNDSPEAAYKKRDEEYQALMDSLKAEREAAVEKMIDDINRMLQERATEEEEEIEEEE